MIGVICVQHTVFLYNWRRWKATGLVLLLLLLLTGNISKHLIVFYL